jgi:hypothetical protein
MTDSKGDRPEMPEWVGARWDDEDEFWAPVLGAAARQRDEGEGLKIMYLEGKTPEEREEAWRKAVGPRVAQIYDDMEGTQDGGEEG